jgi:F-type H+-transporting ATPase subunit epsilon
MIHLKLVTLSGIKFDGEAYEVSLPTMDGQITVLSDHMPLISAATNGVISIRKNPKDPESAMEHFATHGGVIEIADNNVRIIVDEADSGDEINESDAKKALELAVKMKNEAKDQISLEKAQQMIDRSNIRIQVAELKRRRR